MQTNEILGAHTMHIHGYTWNDPRNASALAQEVPVPFNWHPRSPNHEAEGDSVGLGEHLPPDCDAETALEQAAEYLSRQRQSGHCCSGPAVELFTNSHAPIWYRAQASGLLTTLIGGSAYASLALQYKDWWAHEAYLCGIHRVPSGPLTGRSVGVCARYNDPGYNDTRDVCYSLITTGKAKKPARYWKNAEGFQDTVASLLVRMLVQQGAFKNLQPTPPTMPSGLILAVDQYEGGHVSRLIAGQFSAKDPLAVAVDYATGTVSTSMTDRTGGDLPIGDFGRREKVTTVPQREEAR